MIRKMEVKDYRQVKNLVYQVHSLHCKNRPDIYTDGDPLPEEYFHKVINDNNAINYVFLDGDRICGLLMAVKQTNPSIYIVKSRTVYFIEDIVVNEAYRRKGIGKQLYHFLLEMAKKENVDAVELNVWAFNKPAIKFYGSLGMSVKNIKMEQKI